MSEEILKALMQLFAIIAKQDVGLSKGERAFVENFLRQQLNESAVEEYLTLFDSYIDTEVSNNNEPDENTGHKLTSVKDSVKILGIARKINKTLTQKQKAVVLVKLLEMVNSENKLTPQRIAIIDTTADVFNITKQEYNAIQAFVLNTLLPELDLPEILITNAADPENSESHFILANQLEGSLIFLRIQTVDMFFMKYNGNSELFLNGLPIKSNKIYIFASGSVIRQPKGKPLFYTDIAAQFITENTSINIRFKAEDLNFIFANGNKGLQDINIQEVQGKMVAIMGNSGSGKTTLLNVLSGIEKPTSGNVLINDTDIHKDKEKVKGIIGYIPQDDLLIEDLTVWENLFFSTLLVYRDIPRQQIKEKVDNMLTSLGLAHIKNLKVGNTMNKKISGGQRKRLNIGLELIREPSVLFVDEPTSGLSSRDSENVMELLRELTAKGKLIFVVIHQPSSEIFKMFDKIAILDDGGVQIYYGNPVEAAMYFKKIDNQINSEQGECPRCGNVNPETIFNIIESRIVDEYGKTTGIRKVQPAEWAKHFKNNGSHILTNYETDNLPEYDKKPGWLKQFRIFFKRDIKSKLANKQYVSLNLLEAPFLAFLLAFVIRYIDDPTSTNYIFRDNGNIMPYLFICTIVAVFTGLIVSAEEIYKDRKIRKRESFLNLSRSSYLFSKMGILFIISAIQSFLFVWVGNSILGIQGMYFEYWLVFFSLAALANVTGLIISSAFNSAVTIYILIPFLIIPQMVLTGAMFSFDRINRTLGGGREKVPLIAEFMPTRWAFEALVVHQFINNEYEKHFYGLRKLESTLNFKNVYYIPELKTIAENWKSDYLKGEDNPLKVEDKELLYNEISRENNSVFAQHHQVLFKETEALEFDNPDPAIADKILTYLDHLSDYYSNSFNNINNQIDSRVSEMVSTPQKREQYQKWYNDHYNNHLATFAKNTFAPLPLVRLGNRLIQKIDPIYLEPVESCLLCFRTHFLAPQKNFAGNYFSTFYFNVAILWLFTILAYIALYYNLLKKVFVFFEQKKSLNQ